MSQLGSFKSTGEGEAGSEMLPYNWLTLVSMPFQRQWIKGFLVCFWYPYIPICRLNGDIQSNWHPGNRFFKNTYRNFASIKKSTMSINWITKASEKDSFVNCACLNWQLGHVLPVGLLPLGSLYMLLLICNVCFPAMLGCLVWCPPTVIYQWLMSRGAIFN